MELILRYAPCCRGGNGACCESVARAEQATTSACWGRAQVGFIVPAPRLRRSAPMLNRVASALLRSPVLLLYFLLCVFLSGIGFAGAYLLLTLGLVMLGDPLVVWLLGIFGLVWGLFWLYLLAMVLRGVAEDEP